jgi:uncharacterized protein YeaO (DUF488 family)
MKIFTGCILNPIHEKYRDKTLKCSIMSRHTREDGKTPDPRLQYDLHMPHLAPDQNMVGAWLRKEITWEEYIEAYLKKLRTDPRADFWIKAVLYHARTHAVILCCLEAHHSECHRGTLAEYICGEWAAKHPEYGKIDVMHLEGKK